jgi:hypothetical protein
MEKRPTPPSVPNPKSVSFLGLLVGGLRIRRTLDAFESAAFVGGDMLGFVTFDFVLRVIF